MKESRYNLYLKDSTGMVIYNAMSDEIVVLNPQLADLVYENRKQSQKKIPPFPLCKYSVATPTRKATSIRDARHCLS